MHRGTRFFARLLRWKRPRVENEGRRATERLDLFKRIRQLGRSLIVACASADEALELTKELGKDGLARHVGGWLPGYFKNESEMEAFLKRLRAA